MGTPLLSDKLLITLNRSPDTPPFAFVSFSGLPDMAAFCSPLKRLTVDQGWPVMRLIEILQKTKRKRLPYPSRSGATRGMWFYSLGWSNGQKKFTMILRGFRTDLFTKTIFLSPSSNSSRSHAIPCRQNAVLFLVNYLGILLKIIARHVTSPCCGRPQRFTFNINRAATWYSRVSTTRKSG